VPVSRFLPFRLERHLVPSLAEPWLGAHGLECRGAAACVSPGIVGLHYVRPEEMYTLEFLLGLGNLSPTNSSS
jgi:hypothetical protein